jgi:hypothetical protein
MTITRPVGGQRPLLDDPRLPGASLVLSADALASWLSGMVGTPCTVTLRRVRHEPGASVAVSFDLTTTRDGRRSTQPYLARATAVRAGRAGRSSAGRHRVAPHQVLACDPARAVLVTGAGADDALPLLPVLFAPDGPATVLGHLLPNHRCAGSPRVRTMNHDVEWRWVGVLEHDDGEPLLVRAYRSLDDLKVGADANTGLAGAAVRTPALVGTSTQLTCTAVRFAGGRHLGTSARPEEWRGAGAALAGLHDSTGLPLPVSVPTLAAFDGAADILASLLPERASEVRELAGILTRILERIPRDRVPLHGTFSPDRVVFDSDAVPTLVAVESAGFGPSAADVGSLVAATMVTAEAAGMAPRGRREVRAFLDGYASVRRAPDTFAVGVHAVAQRVRTAIDPFLDCAPDWREQVGRRVDGAWTALDEVCVVGGLR